MKIVLISFIFTYILMLFPTKDNSVSKIYKNEYVKTKFYLDTFNLQGNMNEKEQTMKTQALTILKNVIDSLRNLYQCEVDYLPQKPVECKGACYTFSINSKIDEKRSEESKLEVYAITFNVSNTSKNKKITYISFNISSFKDKKAQNFFSYQSKNFIKTICSPTSFKVKPDNEESNTERIIIKKIKNKNKKEYIDVLNFHTYNSISFFCNEVNRGRGNKKKLYNCNIYEEEEIKNIDKKDKVLKISIKKETKDSVFIEYKNYRNNEVFNKNIISLGKKDIENQDYTEFFYKNYLSLVGSKSILE